MTALADPWSPSLAVLAAAVAIDVVLGELPASMHPVVWMGRLTAAGARLAHGLGAAGRLVVGAVLAIGIPVLFAAAAYVLLAATAGTPVVQLALATVLLTSTFAMRALGQAASDVRAALARGRLADARFGLRSLCSRDAAALDEPALVAATVESIAENASDSVVAPLLYYAVLGVPGAMFYRAVNTLDAMIGYRGEYEHLGKAAARLDDVLNFVPARITAAVLLAAGWLCGGDARRGWRVLARDGGRTASPNAGRPMAAMAGMLDVTLEKAGQYRLGDGDGPLGVTTIERAWRLAVVAFGLALAATALAIEVAHGGA